MDKLQEALRFLGERYVFHPTNAVKKAPQRQPELQRTNVAKTFRRERARLAEIEKLS